jgi:DNA-3-methyladenine glycosylase I
MGPAAPLVRCQWAHGSAEETEYHDTVWGRPQRDPRVLFEFLILEGAQAGLSWRTILRKIDGYRAAFAGFDPAVVSRFTDHDIDRCLADPGIVRNRAKVRSAVNNARVWMDLDDPAAMIWGFVDGVAVQNRWDSSAQVPALTPASEAMSGELRRLGFTFVGPTICYAYMQACGLVNDHLVDCFRYAECARLS